MELQSERSRKEAKSEPQDSKESNNIFARYLKFQDMGIEEEQIREMMVCDGLDEAHIKNFFHEDDPDPQIAALRGYTVIYRKPNSSGGTYVFQHSGSGDCLRLERHADNFLAMANDRILFSSKDPMDRFCPRLERTLKRKIKNVDIRIDIEFHETVFYLNLAPSNSIDVKIFDEAMKVLKDQNLHPFPDYIMHKLSPTSWVRDEIQVRSNSYSVECGRSPYGIQIEPFFAPLHEFQKVKVGILDDFVEYPYSHGSHCREIIDTLDAKVQNVMGTNSYETNIAYFPYNFVGTLAEREQGGQEDNSDLEESALAKVSDVGKRITHANQARVSLLLEHLNQAQADEIHILNISVDWRVNLPEESLNNMLIELRACFRKLREMKCFCVISAGNHGLNLDEDFQAAAVLVNGARWRTRSLFVTLAREEEFRENMVVVGASGVYGQYCDFSNYGLSSVTFAAPGENIALHDGLMMTGTSAAAPLVSGAIAVLLQHFPFTRIQKDLLLARIADTLDPITLKRWSEKVAKKSRFDGRINISRVLRKEVLGPFGILSEEDLPEGAGEAILDLNEDMQSEVKFERSLLRIQNLCSVGFRYEKVIQEMATKQSGLYKSVLTRLETMKLEDEVALKWKEFEMERIQNKLKNVHKLNAINFEKI